MLKLQSDLGAAREQAAEREAELRDELQQVRRDKQEVQAILGRLDLNKMVVQLYSCCKCISIVCVTQAQAG